MNTLIQLKNQELRDKILEVFSAAAEKTLSLTTKLSGVTFAFGALLKAVRKLDVSGAFIPEDALKDPSLTLEQLAQASERFVVALRPALSLWDRVRRALANAGALAAEEIKSGTTLQQIGVGSDWIGYLDEEFEPEGLRFFDNDFKKTVTADDVYQVVAGLIEKKII